eukprot:GHVQ01035283.1.p2 GENE.GHVQ01035283.1~~GHVQ01035283.1.p2  ORF type:complete len:318 (-),score=38.42 GHVQ01035283.1:2323-3276(-)
MASTGISLDQLLSARETQLDRLHKADDAMLTPTGDLSTVSAPIGVAEMAQVQDLLNTVLSAIETLPAAAVSAEVSKTISESSPQAAAPATGIKSSRQKVTVGGSESRRAPVSLHVTKQAVQVNIIPREVKSYDKSVQATQAYHTADSVAPEGTGGTEEGSGVPGVLKARASGVITAKEVQDDQLRQELKRGVESQPIQDKKPETKQISSEDASRIIETAEFTDFFDKTTKLVERALGETGVYNIMADYSGGEIDDDTSGESEKLKKLDIYHDDKFCKHRPITTIRTSPKFSELMLASYGEPENLSMNDPEGCVLVRL